jgi:uncharacterized membrane protein YuzA (DUF378 family)
MKAIHAIAFILLVIGGLQWGLIGINANWNLVAMLGGTISMIVYILVGLSALYLVFTHKKTCKCCDKSASSQPSM